LGVVVASTRRVVGVQCGEPTLNTWEATSADEITVVFSSTHSQKKKKNEINKKINK
jgi:hypothetical protein